MVQCIIFDFDGVLGHTARLIFDIFKEIHPTLSEEDFKAHSDGNVYLEPKVIMTDGQMTHFYERYGQCLGEAHLKDIEKIVASVPSGIPLFIVSSNDETPIKQALKEKELSSRFSGVFGYQSGKSKIDKLNHIEKEFGYSLASSLFVTDTLGDVKEAKECDLPTIAVTYGMHDLKRLQKASPEIIVENVNELTRILSQLNA